MGRTNLILTNKTAFKKRTSFRFAQKQPALPTIRHLPSPMPRFSRMLFLAVAVLFTACREKPPVGNPREQFFSTKNTENNGDYLATYPLGNVDSSIARLKSEVPEPFQPWGCLSLWYHLPDTPIAANFKLLDLYEKNWPHDTVRAFAQQLRANLYIDLAKFDLAQPCIDEALEICARLDRPMQACDVRNLEARALIYQNNFAGALRSYFAILALLDTRDTSFSDRRAYLYLDIATAYDRSGDFQKMLFWNKKAWAADHRKLEKPLDYKVVLATHIGIAYRNSHPDSALFWTKLAADIQQNQVKKPCSPRLNQRLGRAYLNTGDCGAALPYLMECYQKMDYQSELFMSYQTPLALGECCLCLGKLDSARTFLQESLASPDTGNLANTLQLMAELNARQANWKAAFEASTESRRLSDIKFNAEKARAIADLEAQMVAAEKAAHITQLELGHKNLRQKAQITILGLLLAMGFVATLFIRQRAKHQLLEKEKQSIEQEKHLAETRERLQALELERSQSELKTSIKVLENTQTALTNAEQLLLIKNQIIDQLKMQQGPQPTSDGANAAEQAAAESNPLFSMKILTEADWAQFLALFEQNFPGFGANIQNNLPALTAAETRLFMLIKLGFSTQEIAGVIGIAQDSVWRGRHRLGKKLGLTDTGGLDNFIRQFST